MDFKENENIGTMDVIDRHQFDKEALTNFMEENVEGFEGPLLLKSSRGDNQIQLI